MRFELTVVNFRFCLRASIPLEPVRALSGLGGTPETAELAAGASRVPDSRKGGCPTQYENVYNRTSPRPILTVQHVCGVRYHDYHLRSSPGRERNSASP